MSGLERATLDNTHVDSINGMYNRKKILGIDGIPVMVDSAFDPADIHINEFTSGKSLETIITNAIEQDTVNKIRGQLEK